MPKTTVMVQVNLKLVALVLVVVLVTVLATLAITGRQGGSSNERTCVTSEAWGRTIETCR